MHECHSSWSVFELIAIIIIPESGLSNMYRSLYLVYPEVFGVELDSQSFIELTAFTLLYPLLPLAVECPKQGPA